jgi:hypothetical protein
VPCGLFRGKTEDAWPKGLANPLELLVDGTAVKGLESTGAFEGCDGAPNPPKVGVAVDINGFAEGLSALVAAAKGDGLAFMDEGFDVNGNDDGAPGWLGAPNWLPPKVAMGAIDV